MIDIISLQYKKCAHKFDSSKFHYKMSKFDKIFIHVEIVVLKICKLYKWLPKTILKPSQWNSQL